MSGSVLPTKEAAKVIGCAVQTLYNWRFQGKGPAYVKMGRKVVYREQDLQNFLSKNLIDPEAPQQ